MSVLPVGFGSSGGSYSIANSLRFRASASAYLSRTFGTPTSTKKLAISVWYKPGWISGGAVNFNLLGRASADNGIIIAGTGAYGVSYNDRLLLRSGSNQDYWNMVFRDPSAWYHIFLLIDTAQATQANRARLWVNGVEQSKAASTLTLDSAVPWNVSGVTHTINTGAATYYGDGYLSEYYFTDGQNIAVSDFGEFNSDNVWVPKAYTGTYGTNGFYLPFDDATSTTTLGYDLSGNGNDWTTNNISLTAGTTYDHMVDTPTNNYATLNPLIPSAANITNGNLSSGTTAARGTINSTLINSQWFVTAGGSNVTAGVIDDAGTANTTTVTANKVFAFKMTTAGALSYKNVTDAGAWTSIATGLTGNRWPYSVTQGGSWNFGQQPLPEALDTGFLALSTANLPAVAITNPAEHMDVVLDTGANIKTAMDALFSGNVFEWIKDRANSNNHQLADVNRGLTAILQSNTAAAETTYTAPSGTSVGWGWKANGAGVSNTDGSITSTVSANTTAGFSIVASVGTGVAGTTGHGLGVAPSLIIRKSRTSGTGHWYVYHKDMGAANAGILQATNAWGASSAWNSVTPTSTVFSVGAAVDENKSGDNYITYCFAEIPGYSKFGSYVGNGSVDGPFVFCGFRPRYVLIKGATIASSWILYDTARNAYNVVDLALYPNLSAVEDSAPGDIDITANGFKVRGGTGVSVNNSGETYIFAAFAEFPFGGSNVSPSPAR